MEVTKAQLKEMIREAVRKQLSEARGGRASQMMSQIIQAAGPDDFSQEFVDRMGPEFEDDIRAVLSYVARRLDVEV